MLLVQSYIRFDLAEQRYGFQFEHILDLLFKLESVAGDEADTGTDFAPGVQADELLALLHEMKELGHLLPHSHHGLARSLNPAKLIDHAVVQSVEDLVYRLGHYWDALVAWFLIAWFRGANRDFWHGFVLESRTDRRPGLRSAPG